MTAVSRTKTSTSGGQGNRGRNAYEVARQHLGKNAAQLKVDGTDVGRAMHDGVANNVNCANFVSGVLQATGQIAASQHSDLASGLSANLGRDPNWTQSSSLRNAKPGDVVLMNTGHSNHIVIFAGWQGGKVGGQPLFIGSNNANADGSQRVTISPMNYRVVAVSHFKGGPEVVGATEGAAPSTGLPTGGSGGGSGDASGDYSGPASNKFTYGYHPPAPGKPGPVLAPGDTPQTAGDMTLDELMAWVEQNLWEKMQSRLAQIDADPDFKAFLAKKGVKPGAKITNALRKEFLAQKLGKEMKSRSGSDKDVTKAADAVAAEYEKKAAGAPAPNGTDAPASDKTEVDTEATSEGSEPASPEPATDSTSEPLTVNRYRGGVTA